MIIYLIPAAVVLAIGVLVNYILLPAWSFHNPFIYIFLILLAVVFFLVHMLVAKKKGADRKYGSLGAAGVAALMAVILLFGALSSATLFRAKSYAAVLADDILPTDIAHLTTTLEEASITDRATAENLALRETGTLVDLVSQFDVQASTQITYNGAPTRVMPLDYASIIKWFTNRSTGVPGYITVDMRSQEASICYTEQPMKYTPGAAFGQDLKRHIHSAYPSAILGEVQFELDETGHPYYIVSVMKPTVGLFGGKDVSTVLQVDPFTGEIVEYAVNAVPEWVDRVYPASTIIDQYDNYGKYRGGFWNSIIGQKSVVTTTDGYNYISDSNDTYVYTGVTSVVSDESNIGFIFTNLRTKETRYYELAGAEEYSAMASAEGMVQQYGYTATFPLMLQIEGTPTYCMSLKDAGGLVKMYAMVNVNKYHLVTIGQTLDECRESYRDLILANDVTITPGPSVDVSMAGTVTGKILDIRTGEKEGTTHFYIRLENDEHWYVVSLVKNEEAIVLNTTDTVVLKTGKVADGETMVDAELKSYTPGAPWWEMTP